MNLNMVENSATKLPSLNLDSMSLKDMTVTNLQLYDIL